MCVCIQFYVVLFAAGLQLLSETSSTVELQSSGAGEALVQYRRLVESVGKFIDVHRRLTTIDARLRTTQQRTDHQQQQPVSGRILKSSIFLKKFYGPHKNKVTVLFYPPFDSLFFSLPFYIFSFLFFFLSFLFPFSLVCFFSFPAFSFLRSKSFLIYLRAYVVL